jgi:hypothetical protein
MIIGCFVGGGQAGCQLNDLYPHMHEFSSLFSFTINDYFFARNRRYEFTPVAHLTFMEPRKFNQGAKLPMHSHSF